MHVVIDTGNFTFALVHFVLGVSTAPYVHYPIVSSHLLALVCLRSLVFNNDAAIAHSAVYCFAPSCQGGEFVRNSHASQGDLEHAFPSFALDIPTLHHGCAAFERVSRRIQLFIRFLRRRDSLGDFGV